MNCILCLGRWPSRGAVNRFVFVSILEQQYYLWWRFSPAFSNTLGFLLCLLTISLFLALVKWTDYGGIVI